MRMSVAEYLACEARLAPKLKTTSEGVEREADLHDQIEKECRHRGWPFVHSRMDRRTTTAVGTVDFVIAADGGRTFWIEAKGAKTKVTREQAATIHWLNSLGHAAAIVHSLDEFHEFLKLITVFELPPNNDMSGPSDGSAPRTGSAVPPKL